MHGLTDHRPIEMHTTDHLTGREIIFRFGYRNRERTAELAIAGAPALVLSEETLRTIADHWDDLAAMSQRKALPPLGDGNTTAHWKITTWRGLDVALLTVANRLDTLTLIDRDAFVDAASDGWTMTCPHCERSAQREPAHRPPAITGPARHRGTARRAGQRPTRRP